MTALITVDYRPSEPFWVLVNKQLQAVEIRTPAPLMDGLMEASLLGFQILEMNVLIAVNCQSIQVIRVKNECKLYYECKRLSSAPLISLMSVSSYTSSNCFINE